VPVKAILLFIPLLLISALTMAADPLTDAQVVNYIKSGPEFKQWTVKNQAALKASYMKTKQALPAEASGQQIMEKSMEESGLSDQLMALVKPYGFKSGMQYLNTSQRIMKAMMALSVRSKSAASQETEKRMAEALKRLEQSDMSPEKKAQMRQMLKGSHTQMMAMAKAPEEDIVVVEPHMAEIKKAFELR